LVSGANTASVYLSVGWGVEGRKEGQARVCSSRKGLHPAGIEGVGPWRSFVWRLKW
jgi:hypothetical protein